jgi:glycosyltransferase involved in cell wall biosynthesis
MSIDVTIITPTYNRDARVVKQAVDCVRGQTFKNFKHIVCSDGPINPWVEQVVPKDDPRFEYRSTKKHLGQSGDGIRVQLLDTVETEFVCFLDDDNLIMPTYLEKMVGALSNGSVMSETASFSICQCYHFGPLQAFHGPPPKVLTGIPPKLYHIDMLQCMLRTDDFKKFGGFKNLGYYSDGTTYEQFAEDHSYVEIPEVLCFHLNSY